MIGSRVGNIFIHENLIPNLTMEAYWSVISNVSKEVRMRSLTSCVIMSFPLNSRISLSILQHILFILSQLLLLEDVG